MFPIIKHSEAGMNYVSMSMFKVKLMVSGLSGSKHLMKDFKFYTFEIISLLSSINGQLV